MRGREALSDFQIHLFHEGSLYDAYKLFGAHPYTEKDSSYTQFTVYAPNARNVYLAGSFNDWNYEEYPLEKINNEGIWSCQIKSDLTGHTYKYAIVTPSGHTIFKSDPYAFYSEKRPRTASIVYPLEKTFQWNDKSWFKRKLKKYNESAPLFIYEIHAGTWKKKFKREKSEQPNPSFEEMITIQEEEDHTLYTYRELADELIPYVLEQGFTHIELMPLTEHPFDGSWGYQSTGYFSPTSRYGKPDDLKYFVDQCHKHQIGVLLDWVPGHYCKDAHGLFLFDGEPVYEYQDTKHRENSVWGTANFDLGKTEVHSFLISNAKYWVEYFHIDGFRVDAVANMIFWPNTYDQVNPYGIEFLKKLNKTLKEYDPTLLMMAEDSTDWPGVTKPVNEEGLGFSYKWNMGWMNDILEYMQADPNDRSFLHHKVTFSLMYAYSEQFILPLSHDEVVHGKKSLLDKMPGSYEEKFAQLKLLLGYMTVHPGKKLLFMGGELGMFSEWKDMEELDWNLLEYESHKKLNVFFQELLKIYKRSKPLYEMDADPKGFEWIDVHNTEQSVFSFIRRDAEGNTLVIVCNFKNIPYEHYRIGVPGRDEYREILNSDDRKFGGSHHINKKPIQAEEGYYHGKSHYITMNVSPYGISILRPVEKRKEIKQNGKEKDRRNAVGRRARNKT